MNDELTIRPYQEGDEEEILKTFNLVFREVCGPEYVDRTMAQWQWAYRDNPAGRRMSLAVAEDGTVASQYAGMLMRCDTPWGERRLLHCVDSMTHPDWRQGLKAKSLFVETGLPFLAYSREVGDALLYGFPVTPAYRIGKRYLEYSMMRIIDFLIRDLSAPTLPAPAGVAVEQVTEIPDECEALYAEVRADKQFLLRRDRTYLDWRYVQNPQRDDYELWTARRDGVLRGLMVLKPGSGLAPDACTVADWVVPEVDADVSDALLAKAVARQRDEGKQRLMTVFPPWSHEHRLLAQRGFVETPSATWLQRRLIHCICRPEITPEFVSQSWWYTLGDSDLA